MKATDNSEKGIYFGYTIAAIRLGFTYIVSNLFRS